MSSCTRLVTGSLWSDLKIGQKQLIGGRNGQNYGTLKWAHRSNQSVLGIHNIWETTENWENQAISSGLVTRRLYLKKKGHSKAIFPPCTNWPICYMMLLRWDLGKYFISFLYHFSFNIILHNSKILHKIVEILFGEQNSNQTQPCHSLDPLKIGKNVIVYKKTIIHNFQLSPTNIV